MSNEYDLKPAIVTNNVKLMMTFIDRVGFPIMAFLLMFWLVIKMGESIQKLNDTLTTQTEILRDLKAQMRSK